ELLSIDLDASGRSLEIVAPMAGSPAAAADLHPHDRVTAIDGRAVDVARYAEAMAALRARAGVRLTVERGGAARDVELAAAALPPYAAVTSSRAGDTLVVRFGAFGADSAAAFADLLARERPAALELDLRGHTGGQVNAVLAIAGMLASADLTAAEVVGPGGARTPLVARASPRFRGPIAIRVDRGTASGAELLAAALRSSARVTGGPTFGKCLVHQGAPLSNGRLLLFTSGRLAEPGSRPWCASGLAFSPAR
ncbi:MAG TPA: S41 family peptidase, partial [Kofleriaceae bacterium]|nr:S41 family peptidase [Kofleriaceae bacterium]